LFNKKNLYLYLMYSYILKYKFIFPAIFLVLVFASCQKGGEPVPSSDGVNTTSFDSSARYGLVDGDEGDGDSETRSSEDGSNIDGDDGGKDDGTTIVGGDDNEDDDINVVGGIGGIIVGGDDNEDDDDSDVLVSGGG
jgi:hypothetical protein